MPRCGMREPDRERGPRRRADTRGEPALRIDRDRDHVDGGGPAGQHRAAHVDVALPRRAVLRRLDVDLRRRLVEVDDQRRDLVLLHAVDVDPVGVRALPELGARDRDRRRGGREHLGLAARGEGEPEPVPAAPAPFAVRGGRASRSGRRRATCGRRPRCRSAGGASAARACRRPGARRSGRTRPRRPRGRRWCSAAGTTTRRRRRAGSRRPCRRSRARAEPAVAIELDDAAVGALAAELELHRGGRPRIVHGERLADGDAEVERHSGSPRRRGSCRRGRARRSRRAPSRARCPARPPAGRCRAAS